MVRHSQTVILQIRRKGPRIGQILGVELSRAEARQRAEHLLPIAATTAH
jgi:hypothetical protein